MLGASKPVVSTFTFTMQVMSPALKAAMRSSRSSAGVVPNTAALLIPCRSSSSQICLACSIPQAKISQLLRPPDLAISSSIDRSTRPSTVAASSSSSALNSPPRSLTALVSISARTPWLVTGESQPSAIISGMLHS